MRRQSEVNEEAEYEHEPEVQLSDFTNIKAHMLIEAQIEAQEVLIMEAQINLESENNSQIKNPEPEINPQIQDAQNNVLANTDPPACPYSETNFQPLFVMSGH
ncbi:hypothetical protein ElyMa_000191700 [Elysia marginata]|uniref:Uncharacterized protein n=1 Tax=Elysia marginata TaxID=1093978 RepID=A0AAV4EW81_9GAST|nr:hypothetical protein ElyMa_000191700 [Elysia marginata]